MSKPVYINNDTFKMVALQAPQPVLVDFYADWCGPCTALAPAIEEVAEKLKGRLVVAKLDVEQSEELSLRYGVQSIPTLILFQNGEEVGRLVGFLPKASLLKALQRYLAAGAASERVKG